MVDGRPRPSARKIQRRILRTEGFQAGYGGGRFGLVWSIKKRAKGNYRVVKSRRSIFMQPVSLDH